MLMVFKSVLCNLLAKPSACDLEQVEMIGKQSFTPKRMLFPIIPTEKEEAEILFCCYSSFIVYNNASDPQ